MSSPTITSQRNRCVSVLICTLLLFVALLASHTYGKLLSSPSQNRDLVSRLRIAEFKPIYDRQILLMGTQVSERWQTQNIDNGDLYLIDVRPDESFAAGHIRGAISLPEPELETRISSIVSPARSDPLIVLYCA
jgi:hypothetical protein